MMVRIADKRRINSIIWEAFFALKVDVKSSNFVIIAVTKEDMFDGNDEATILIIPGEKNEDKSL